MDPGTAVLALVALGFFLAAYAHTSVGLGGGSSYTAIQSLAGFPVGFIPPISLVFNLLATSLGSVNFIRGGHFAWRRLARPPNELVGVGFERDDVLEGGEPHRVCELGSK